MTTIAATPTKLRDGSWGARTQASVRAGDLVTITTRAGKSWDARVTRVVWSGDAGAICATESLDRGRGRTSRSISGRRRGGTRTGCSCGSVYEYTKSSDCWTCQHDA